MLQLLIFIILCVYVIDNNYDYPQLSMIIRFIIFLVHFSVESFEDSRVRLLGLLQTHLLQGNSLSPSRDGERFVMMVTINMFAVHQKLLEMKGWKIV